MDYIYQKPAWPCACVRAGARTLEVKNRRPWKTTNSTATIATWHTKGKKKMKKKKENQHILSFDVTLNGIVHRRSTPGKRRGRKEKTKQKTQELNKQYCTDLAYLF